MPDKDQFTFDDDDFPANRPDDRDASSGAGLSDDDFPETDFSAIFPEGEHPAEEPGDDEPVARVTGGGQSRTRILLLILFLVGVGAAGAYYFMDLGGTTSVSTVVLPAQPGSKSVALPPQPAEAPAVDPQIEPSVKNVTVAAPPPPPQPADVTQSQEPSGVLPSGPAVSEPSPSETAKLPGPAPAADLSPKDAVPQAELPTAAEADPAVESARSIQQVEGGAFTLDAGSYLLESNRKALVEKIKQLGYEPLITPLDATLNMTRLRLGTFSKDEVHEALAFARKIEPGSYSTPAGEGYVIYAGTFLKRDNVNKLSQRFSEEGVKVYPEPVQVVRTLSRVRFGRFATREDAMAASREVGAAGLKADVVKAK